MNLALEWFSRNQYIKYKSAITSLLEDDPTANQAEFCVHIRSWVKYWLIHTLYNHIPEDYLIENARCRARDFHDQNWLELVWNWMELDWNKIKQEKSWKFSGFKWWWNSIIAKHGEIKQGYKKFA